MNFDSIHSYMFDLPDDLIAKRPVNPRDHSRLMIVDRKTGLISEMPFYQLKDFLEDGDQLIFNNTKVIPARLFGKKETGAKIELLLIKEEADQVWQALVKPAKKALPGTEIYFNDGSQARVEAALDDGIRTIKFDDIDQLIENEGMMPLPPYIRREAELSDKEDYQTVYASRVGAVAAPTAGLHFTKELLRDLQTKGVKSSFLTLHVGLGTFRPVQVEDIKQHQMHEESFEISQKTADEINSHPKDRRQIIVGTTCMRALESAILDGRVVSGAASTDIFITPGYSFKTCSSLLTNFHLPGSTLLMLISAFGGYELIMEAYKKAVLEKYRFFSYGDAMLIL